MTARNLNEVVEEQKQPQAPVQQQRSINEVTPVSKSSDDQRRLDE